VNQRIVRRVVVGLHALALCGFASARASHAQRGVQPAVHPLGPIEARCSGTFGNVKGVRQLSDGSVLVSDNSRLQLLLFDSTLSHSRVILDSVSGARFRYLRYRSHTGLLAPFTAESTLFLDEASSAYLVVGPHGEMARVIGIPGNDLANIRNMSALFTQVIDPAGRLVYQTTATPLMQVKGHPLQAGPRADSVALVRTRPVTGDLDTLAWIRVPTTYGNPPLVNPVPLNDDWALFADGSIAIVREYDFHVDWIGPDGTVRHTGRTPFDWQRLTDSAKEALTDSAHAYYVAHPLPNYTTFLGVDNGTRTYAAFAPDAVPDSALPDYAPPFGGHTALGDADMHLWIAVFSNGQLPPADLAIPSGGRSTAPPPPPPAGPRDGLVYDVIDRNGALIDRVQIPGGTTIAGFGPGGAVYLTSREGDGVHLVRARIR